MSEEAARIANAKANDKLNPSQKGGQSPRYVDWPKEHQVHQP